MTDKPIYYGNNNCNINMELLSKMLSELEKELNK